MAGASTYFRLPHPLWMLTISFGLFSLFMARFYPLDFPSWFGPWSQLVKAMGTDYKEVTSWIWIFAASAHVVEAVIAFFVARKKKLSVGTSIKWTISTFCFGFASLLLRLVPYQPKPRSLLD